MKVTLAPILIRNLIRSQLRWQQPDAAPPLSLPRLGRVGFSRGRSLVLFQGLENP